MEPAIYLSSIASLPLLARGKVRDMYAVGEDKLLIVATDRISAFDVIMGEPVPGKGKVLTRLTEFWLDRLAHVLPNHATGIDPRDVVDASERDQVEGRAMVVKRLQPVLVEAVARGYLAGSGWHDYQASGAVCGVPLPPGLDLADRLPEPIFTPAAKAEAGQHDENISFDHMVSLLGADLATRIRQVTLELYGLAAEHAAGCGIIIADTKFEFGLDEAGRLCLMDEVLTPDSSRFWPQAQYRPGQNPPSFDKQFLRDWLIEQGWDKMPPAPEVPEQVLLTTRQKYVEALERLAGVAHG